MKEKILSSIFTSKGDSEELIKKPENSIYDGTDDEEYAGYLERKATLLDILFRSERTVTCRKVRIDEIENEVKGAEENKVEIARLAESIRKHGMMLPVTVCRTEGQKYRIIDGVKRFNAVKLLEREEIFCVILPCTEKVGEVLRITGESGDVLDYGRKVGSLLLDSSLDRELLRSTSLLSDRKIGSLLDIAALSESEAAHLRQITLERLICEISAIPDPRFRDYVIITFADFFKDFEQDVKKIIENKDRRYTQSDKMIFKDIRLVFNSIDGSLNKLRKSGIRVNTEKSENATEYTYFITVRKP